jgi:LacI family repressor for deo operon, udp, cdd, tsx, nupC, and nupG
LVGIEDVARRAGVSTATVSRALSGNGPVSKASRRKVVEAAALLDYVVSSSASGLASGRTNNIGLIIPALARWYFSATVEGAQQALMKHGYDVTLYGLSGEGAERDRVFDLFLQRQRIDGLVAISLELSPSEVQRLRALGKPVVAIGGPIDGIVTLAVDDIEISRLATQHLLALGHTEIAHVAGAERFDSNFHIPTNRHVGYELALRDAGIEIRLDFTVNADFTIEGGYHSAKQLLGDPRRRPTAIFAACDEMAIGCILAARELGLVVPRDVSIIGIDGHELSEFFGLTTVAQYPREQGSRAVDLVVEQLRPGAEAEHAVNLPLAYDLIVRTSTASPPVID